MKSHSVEINLLGQRIVVKSSAEPEVVEEVAALVSKKIKAAEQRKKITLPHHVAVLALLDLAEEYVEAKRRFKDFQRSIEEKTEKIGALIDAEFR